MKRTACGSTIALSLAGRHSAAVCATMLRRGQKRIRVLLQNTGPDKTQIVDLTQDVVVDLTEPDEPASATVQECDTPAPTTQQECVVCMDRIGTEGAPQALGCLHVFCRGCIAQCITAQLDRGRQLDCPVCKRLIPAEEQVACGVDRAASAYASAEVDMFAPAGVEADNLALSRERAEAQARMATFSGSSARSVWHSRATDPGRLLDRHLQHQRVDRHSSLGRTANDRRLHGQPPSNGVRRSHLMGPGASGSRGHSRHGASSMPWP